MFKSDIFKGIKEPKFWDVWQSQRGTGNQKEHSFRIGVVWVFL